MPLIKPRTRGKKFVRLVTRLEQETNETLYAYAQFLGEPIEYVLNQLIDTVLAKDKEFMTWRAAHPHACAPRPKGPKQAKASGTRVPTGLDAPTVTPSRSAVGGQAPQ